MYSSQIQETKITWPGLLMGDPRWWPPSATSGDGLRVQQKDVSTAEGSQNSNLWPETTCRCHLIDNWMELNPFSVAAVSETSCTSCYCLIPHLLLYSKLNKSPVDVIAAATQKLQDNNMDEGDVSLEMIENLEELWDTYDSL